MIRSWRPSRAYPLCLWLLLLVSNLWFTGCIDTLVPLVGGGPAGDSFNNGQPPPPNNGQPPPDDGQPPPPPDDGNPPDNPPPPPPPPDDDNPPPDLPPPPPDGDIAYGGHVFQGGFWNGWRADEERNYIEVNGHGGMIRNAQAVRYIGTDGDGHGRFGFDVYFTNGDQLNYNGGSHLGGISSNSLVFRPRDANGNPYPWDTTRIDLDIPSEGRIRAVLFNWLEGQPLYNETHWFNVPIGLGRWGNIDTEWHQQGNELSLTVNGQTHVFNLRPGSPMLGRYIYLGNMDHITGAIEFDNFYYSQ